MFIRRGTIYGVSKELLLRRHTIGKRQVRADYPKVYTLNPFLSLGTVFPIRVTVRSDVPALLKSLDALGIRKTVLLKRLPQTGVDDIDMHRFNRAVARDGLLCKTLPVGGDPVLNKAPSALDHVLFLQRFRVREQCNTELQRLLVCLLFA